MTKKFTSEDLLKAMGLKVGQCITIKEFYMQTYKIIKTENGEIAFALDGDINDIIDLVGLTIIQPKPILTEDEKVILRNVSCTGIIREMNDDGFGGLRENLWLIKGEIKYDFNIFRHLFKSIELKEPYAITQPYPIEELLGESV